MKGSDGLGSERASRDVEVLDVVRELSPSGRTALAGTSGCGPSKSKKSMCRYGRGCTHLIDPSHREKFWHPPALAIDGWYIENSDVLPA